MKPTTKDAYDLFHRGTLVLSKMEARGFCIDTEYLDRTISEVTDLIERREAKLLDSKVFKKWKKRFGEKTNLDSDRQLSTVLFEEMGLKPLQFTEKTKELDENKRVPSTDESHLMKFAAEVPFLKRYFGTKKLKKARNTYLVGIRRETVNGRLHTSYNLAGGITDEYKGGAASYRSSSQMPNLHNVPIRNKWMKDTLRPAFVAPDDNYHFAEIDFSGNEIKASACYNHDPNLIRYIKDKTTDMHRDTAQEMFFLDREFLLENKEWSKATVRDWCKNRFVFPQFYGSVWFQCAPAIWEAVEAGVKLPNSDVTVKEHLRKHGIRRLGDCDQDSKPARGTFAHHVQEVERAFWEKRFPVYTKWKKKFYATYRENGYFDLLTGFRCSGYYRRNQVINFPVQGVAFHWLLWCLIEIEKEFTRRRLRSQLIGQIHDSIQLYVHRKEVQTVLSVCKEIMTVRLSKAFDWIIVPMETEADLSPRGGSWHEKQEYVQDSNGKWSSKA